MTGRISGIFSIIFAVSLSIAHPAVGQDTLMTVRPDSAALRQSLFTEARACRLDYEFASADSLLRDALKLCSGDSLEFAAVESELLLCENGMNMSRYVAEPQVVARQMFSLSDFFLWYPLPDRSWTELPDSVSHCGGSPFNLCYIAEDSDRILFSARDSSGNRSIYGMNELRDPAGEADTPADSAAVLLCGRKWGGRSSLFGKIAEGSDEIFPMFSQDGRTVYFASKGLYGVGGYDLYCSEYQEDDNSWSIPVNMGFPFSSPANDYLLTTTLDERYMIFASDRDCPRDSVCVYVLENDPLPLKTAVESPEELRRIAGLDPQENVSAVETAAVAGEPVQDNVENRAYSEKMELVRSLRDSIAIHGAETDALREEFVMSDDVDRRQELTVRIREMEQDLPRLQNAYAEASAALQKIEMEFLFNGVFIDADKAVEAADRRVAGVSTNFVFTRKSMASGRE